MVHKYDIYFVKTFQLQYSKLQIHQLLLFTHFIE